MTERLPLPPMRLVPMLLSGALLALVCLATPCAAQEETSEFDTVHREAQVELVADMLGLATWSSAKELFAERDRLYRAVIAIDPDNAAARKGLRYSRKSDGSWQEPAPREAKNRNVKALPEMMEKRAAMVAPFKQRMLAALDAAAAPADSPLRAAIHAEILAADPDDAFVRAARGEARLGEDWVLAETVIAQMRRAEIIAQAKAALDDVGAPRPIPLTDVERDLGLKFTVAIGTSNVRVLGTGTPAECEQAARNCQAAGRFLRAVLDIDTLHREDFTIYLLANDKEGPLFVANLPDLTPEYREILQSCAGALMPGMPVVAYWDRNLATRVDGASRQTIGDFLGRAFGLTQREGWAWEGLGLYLNNAICGTRLTWFVSFAGATSAQKQLYKRLQNPATDWLSEALVVLEQESPPRFETTLERGVERMTLEDALCAHALAAWLVEGRPKDLVAILQRIGGGKNPTSAAFEEVLHLDPPAVQERLRRWLSERR